MNLYLDIRDLSTFGPDYARNEKHGPKTIAFGKAQSHTTPSKSTRQAALQNKQNTLSLSPNHPLSLCLKNGNNVEKTSSSRCRSDRKPSRIPRPIVFNFRHFSTSICCNCLHFCCTFLFLLLQFP